MSDKAETMECVDCSGRGFRGVLGGLCPTCSGTGVRTTGAVVGGLPPAVGIGGYVYAPDHNSGATVTDDRDATIAAQAAEIERLKAESIRRYTENADGTINMLRDQVRQLTDERDEVERERNALLLRVAEDIAPVEADRDVLRLEVQRLKDLNFESQDLYAAIEAERDALRAERSERMGALEAAMRIIDAQNAQVRAMNEQLDAVTQLIVRRVKEVDRG